MLRRTTSLYKNSFTGLSRETWLLSLIMLINRSGTMVLPFMTLYLTGKSMNRSLTEAGLVMGLFGLGSIIGAYFGGKFSDKLGFFKIQLFTLFFGGIIFLILGQINSFPLICVTSFVLSAVNEAFRPANSAAVAFYSNPENRTRSYSLNRLAINFGWAVGASIGGWFASFNYELLFWVDGITNILAAFLLYTFLRPSKLVLKTEEPQLEVPAHLSAYRDKSYLWFIFLITLFALCFFQLFTLVPKYFRDNLGLTESYIGFVMAINGLIIVGVEMVLVYLLEQKRKIVFFISLGTFICALSFFSLLLPGPAKLVALFMILLISFGEIISMPFMNTYWINRSNEKNRGQYAGLYTIAWGIGQTLGPLISSILVEATNFSILFVVLGVTLILASLGFKSLNTLK